MAYGKMGARGGESHDITVEVAITLSMARMAKLFYQ